MSMAMEKAMILIGQFGNSRAEQECVFFLQCYLRKGQEENMSIFFLKTHLQF